ncbi:hypothetical protein ACHAXR_008335 [Thalassiosira sp. AJA248-18]
MTSSTLATILLLLSAASNALNRRTFAAVASTPGHAAAAVDARVLGEGKRDRRPPSKQRRRLPYSKRKHTEKQLDDHSERRVMPWMSFVLLMIILFLFKSFAAPFFDPLGEPRQATASSVYFSLLASLYIWLASVTTLTVLPQFSTNYNIVIAAALFFYMVFVSIIALLLGRFLIRGAYYIWLFWKMGSSSGNALETRIKGCISILSRSRFWSKQNTGQKVTANDNKDRDAFGESAEPHRNPFPVLIAFQRPFRRVFKSAIFLSAALCFLYSHCWSRSLSAFNVSRDSPLVCKGIFVPMLLFSSSTVQTTGTSSCHADQTCAADERSIWILWAAMIIGHLFYYTIHEFAGKHHKGMTPVSTSSDAAEMEVSKSSSSLDIDYPVRGAGSNESDEYMEGEYDDENDQYKHQGRGEGVNEGKDPWQSISTTIQKLKKTKPEQPKEALPMVSWYSNIIFSTGFDMLVSFKIFLGRFDARKMQVAMLKETSDRTRNKPSNSIDTEGVFDFSNCKHCNNDNPDEEKGFWFDFVSDCGDGFNSSYQVSRLLAQPTLNVVTSKNDGSRRILPRGKLLINGGDLAYPDPTPESYEKRFFRTFEDAMPPPPSFRREHISIRKPALPVKGWEMDARHQDGEDENHLSNYVGPCAFLIPGNHDWFDGLSTFTRMILSRDWLGGWLMRLSNQLCVVYLTKRVPFLSQPQRTSYFALKLPRGWWLLGFDLALDDDINIEQFHFFANLAEKSMRPNDSVVIISHVPHWVLNEYENHSNDSEKETNLSELIKTHFRGRVKIRLAGDLHHYTRHVPLTSNQLASGYDNAKSVSNKPVLIVSGGGGAFLHPTHVFQDQITVGQEKAVYSRVCAFPSTKVSRHLSWLNLWQFRWRNWRLDILWAITHFGICSSLFPLCGVYDDYLQFNPTNNLGVLLLWVFRRVLQLFGQILTSGRMSLLFTMVIIGIAYTFTDSSNLTSRTHLGWSLLHAAAHISCALTGILFLECMAEFVVSEGLVVTQNVAANTQSCGTGLAFKIYDEFESHFSHPLEDFQLLGGNFTSNTSNPPFTSNPPDAFPSCRFDESLYEMLSSTVSWLYHEAPFLKTTLAVFDLPGVIGSTHVAMCNVLCSGGAECTYSNDFLKYQQLDRVTIVKYLASISLYFVIFVVPVAGIVFGTWLAVTLNFLSCQYDEGFSSLRMEHWKNFLRMHIDENGDLEIFAIGLPRVPKKWRKDPSWDGDTTGSCGEASTTPSWMWKNPSKWKEWRSRKKFTPQMIDYTKIKRTP